MVQPHDNDSTIERLCSQKDLTSLFLYLSKWQAQYVAGTVCGRRSMWQAQYVAGTMTNNERSG